MREEENKKPTTTKKRNRVARNRSTWKKDTLTNTDKTIFFLSYLYKYHFWTKKFRIKDTLVLEHAFIALRPFLVNDLSIRTYMMSK